MNFLYTHLNLWEENKKIGKGVQGNKESYRVGHRNAENTPLTYNKGNCTKHIVSIYDFPRLVPSK